MVFQWGRNAATQGIPASTVFTRVVTMAMQAGPVGHIRQPREPSNPAGRGYWTAAKYLALLLAIGAAVSLLIFVLENVPWEQFAQAPHVTLPRQDMWKLFPHRRP